MAGSIVEHIEAGVWPAVWERLDTCFPDLHLRFTGKRWQCQQAADEACRRIFGASARRVASTRPGWFTIAGGGSLSWPDVLCGGMRISGSQWRAAVGELGRRVGLDMGWTEGSGSHPTMTAEQIEQHAEKLAAQKRDEEKKREKRIREARQLWTAHAGNAAGCAGYLSARGIDLDRLPGIPDVLTLAKSLPYYRSQMGAKPVRILPDGPCMLARVDDPAGEALAVQRFYLEPGGERKRADEEAKKTIGPSGGGAVRLHDPQGGFLFICEGVETGMAIFAAIHPTQPTAGVWAALYAGNMLKVEIPPEIEERITGIIIAGDHDEVCGHGYRPGLVHAHKAAARLAGLHPKILVHVAVPDQTLVPGMVAEDGTLIAPRGGRAA